MITEDYVSFETAKLLQDKGFNEPTLAYAYGNDMIGYYSKPKITDPLNIEAGRIPMPTLQMAMKWLREEMGLVIIIDYSRLLYAPIPYYFHIYTTSGNNGGREDNLAPIDPYYDYKYKTYEEACEAAIKYCLENLI